jgi:predicted PurR-regulated permease PerM
VLRQLRIGLIFLGLFTVLTGIIYPLVVRKIVGIPPVITILALVIGAKIAGFMGIILSVPIASIIIEILNDIDQKKRSYESEAG